ncbi:hypothetical protein AB0M02_31400 [Actinoplanes sp. NPDC051861]|uniref:hypothetical protein n=1 Tax=Actinoplanes sp. NPDC051861 TaxID=3155170 RepID=UPI003426A307
MTDHAQTRFWSGIDIPKALAATLAAVSAAVVGSFLGVAGTLIGAAVASLISSVGTEVYHRSIDRGTRKLQQAFVTAPAAVGTPEVTAAHEPPSEQETEPRRIHWKRVGLVAAALFVVALGALTTFELMAGKTAADAVNGRDGGSPTLLNFSDNSDKSDSPQPESTEQTTEQTTEPNAPAETTAPAEPTGEATGEVTEPPATGDAPTAGDETEQDGSNQQEGAGSGR